MQQRFSNLAHFDILRVESGEEFFVSVGISPGAPFQMAKEKVNGIWLRFHGSTLVSFPGSTKPGSSETRSCRSPHTERAYTLLSATNVAPSRPSHSNTCSPNRSTNTRSERATM